MAALEDGGLERGDVLRGGGIIPVRELTAQGEDAVGDGAVELERGVAVEIGLQRELQLLELQLLLPNPADGVERAGVGIDGDDRLARPRPSPLRAAFAAACPDGPCSGSSSRTSQPVRLMLSSEELR